MKIYFWPKKFYTHNQESLERPGQVLISGRSTNPQQEALLIIMNSAMGMPTPEGADAAMPNLPEAMAGINPRKSI